jgi:hypothetical protein
MRNTEMVSIGSTDVVRMDMDTLSLDDTVEDCGTCSCMSIIQPCEACPNKRRGDYERVY